MALGSAATLGKLGSVLAVAAGSALAAVVIVGPPPKLFNVGPRAWFDEPLDGSYLEEGPVHIVAHAADPDGVVEVVLSVGGEAAQTVDAGGDQLVEVELNWDPPADGTFELSVVGVDNHDNATAPDTLTVHIGENPGELALEDALTTTTTLAGDTTTSSEAEGSTTLTTSKGQTTTSAGGTTTTIVVTTTTELSTTTTLACPGQTTNASPTSSAVVPENPTLTWGYTGCEVAGFVVHVSRDPEFLRRHQETFIDWPDRSTTAAVTCGDGVGPWYWRVQASSPGPWSSPTSFTLRC